MAKAAKSKALGALDYLAQPRAHAAGSLCVLLGGEAFLKMQVLGQLRHEVLGDGDGDFSLTTIDGTAGELRDVLDVLSTVALFGDGRRMVVVENADPFVSRFRSGLELYAAKPAASGVLVLLVDSFPSNTRLYKAAGAAGLVVDCGTPPGAGLCRWLVAWAKQNYGAAMDSAAADTLLEHVEPNMGLLDQELAKLALLAGEGGRITASLVAEAVGTWRTRTTWDMLDAALAGNAGEALAQLDRLLVAGEVPVSVLGQISATLRRFAAATRLIQRAERSGRRIKLRDALVEAGFKTWPAALSKAERQLRHIGRIRGGQLHRLLAEADLALKGERSAPTRARTELERLLVRLGAGADQVARLL